MRSENGGDLLIKAIPMGLFTVDLEQRITLWNRMAEKITGLKEENVVGTKCTELWNCASCIENCGLLEKSIKKPILQAECSITLPGDKALTLSKNVDFLRDEKNNIIGGIETFVDITEQKAAEREYIQLEEQLHQSQKMKAIGQLAGGIAHDFNNMLGVILGNADMIRTNADQMNPKIEQYTDRIIKAAQRSSDLTAKLLAYARKEEHVVARVNIHDVIQDTENLLKHTIDKRISITQRLNASSPIVMGEYTQLRNALLNLAMNARDSMPEGGELIFETEITKLDKKYLDNLPYKLAPGDYVMISVADTGIGMNKETKSRIFEPFFTTKEVGKGTGLGLTSVYGTLKGHGGSIEVFSKVGKGTLFELYLPLIAEQNEGEIEDLPEITNSTGRILVADDEELIRDITEEILQDLGYTVTLCQDGEEAVEIYQKNFRDFDLVIIDIIMPKLGGLRCFLELKKINPNVMVIVSSGYATKEEKEKLLKAGIMGIVQKPFTIDNLSKVVLKVLKRRDT